MSFRTVRYEGADVAVPIPKYKYPSYKHNIRQFRLLEILDDNHESLIRCRLKIRSLDNPPPYTALSYEWGDPSRVDWIILDSRRFPVTRNLALALYTLRHRGRPLVWIDAICIDQNNEKEKDAHIPLMTKIYHQAESVSVWLGPSRDGSKKVMDICRRVDISRRESATGEPWRPEIEYLKKHEDKLQAFFHRTYWRRAWIVQEISVASRVYLLCGSRLASWNGLELFMDQMQHYADEQDMKESATQPFLRRLFSPPEDMTKNDIRPLLVSTSYRHVSKLLQSRIRNLEGAPGGLLENIYETRHTRATDPRDKVFALLGLSSDRFSFVENPTYAWSEMEMCLEMTKAYFWSKKSLDIIFLAPFTTSADEATRRRLPSWCPDYLRLGKHGALRMLCSYLSGHADRVRIGQSGWKWRTTGGSTISRNTVTITHQQRLSVRAKHICKIHSVGVGLTSASETQPATRDAETLPEIHSSEAVTTINNALIMYATDHERLSQYPSMLRFFFDVDCGLYNAHHVRQLKTRFEYFMRWRALNDNLVVGPKRFKDTAKSWRAHYLGSTIGDIITARTMTGNYELSEASPRRTIPPELVAGLESLILMIDEGLSLASTKDTFHVGWVHPDARPGDEVFLITGCSTPAVLRRSREFPGTYEVVGHAYIDGFMDGNFWHSLRSKDLQEVVIC